MLLHALSSRKLRLLLCLLLVGGLAVVLTDAASAKKKSRSSRKNFILSEQTGRKLLKVGEYAEQEKYEEALAVLDGLAKRRRLKAHDKAVVYQNRGMMQAALDRYSDATKSFEVALEQDALPDSTRDTIRYNLAQLYMAEENFDRATELLEQWFETAENPGHPAYFLITVAYAQQERFDKALPTARKMVEKSPEPKEQYLQLLLAIEFQNGNIPETLQVLKTLVTLFPRKSYYLQLAYGYSNLGEEENALAMLEFAHAQGWLEKSNELVNLAQRYLYHNLPYPAAQVIEKGIEAGTIEKTTENYELLATALLYAREYDRALPPLERAAEMSDNGNLYVRLAQVYLEVENWPRARTALESALKKGDLRDTANAQLLLGISNFNEKRYESARSAFQLAAKDDNVARSARRWLKHVDRKLRNGEG